MDLDYPGEIPGVSLYFAPGFALGYATLLADLCGLDKAEDAIRFFAAHDFTDTCAYGISPEHCHAWSYPPHTQDWDDPYAN